MCSMRSSDLLQFLPSLASVSVDSKLFRSAPLLLGFLVVRNVAAPNVLARQAAQFGPLITYLADGHGQRRVNSRRGDSNDQAGLQADVGGARPN